MTERGEQAVVTRVMFRKVFEEILGSAGVKVLEYHFRKISSKDLYELLCSDPKSFYETLTHFFGSGTVSFIRTVASILASKYGLFDEYTPDELTEILMGKSKNPPEDLHKILERSSYLASRGEP